MIKKLLSSSLLFIFLLPFVTQAQEPNYFPNRLIIKYESADEQSRLKAKMKTDPETAVQQFLMRSGAREIRPLFSDQFRQKLRHKNSAASRQLLRIHEVMLNGTADPTILAGKISSMPGVAYAEPKYIRQMYFEPDDNVIEKFVDQHNFREAWDISQGSEGVVIAVIDGGVGYTHPELDDKLWVNQDEVPPTLRPQADQDGNGTVTSTEIQQYLDDNNGDYNGDGTVDLDDALHADSPFMDNNDTDNNDFTDDLFGWDFWADENFNQDNNPIHEDDGGTDHGTHVAGIAAAETNNGTGVVGTGFNSSFMPVKTGGIPDDPNTPNIDESRAIGFGFQGILYAAMEGADIINCSWGGGGFSQAEQDVIDFANESGSVVVAASGNEGIDQVGYPAGYDKVIAVGSVETGNTIANYSNYGYNLDVLATGTDIQSTGFNSAITSKSGTSMSTPVVSGLAALLRDLHPDWSTERIGTQIRTTATNIESNNSSDYLNKLGHGNLNAAEALNTNKPGVKVISQRFENQEGEKLGINQEGTVYITVTNVGNTSSSISMQIQSINDGIQLSSSQQTASLSTGDTTEISFGVTITDNFNLTNAPTFRLAFSDVSQSYRDFNIFRYDKFLYDDIAVNDVKTSLAADGSVGFVDPFSGVGGSGFIPRNSSGNFDQSDNLLFEGGLMIAFEDEISSAVRGLNGQLNREFAPQEVFATTTGGVSDLDGQATFATETDTAKQLQIELETFAYDDPELSNVVFVKYTLNNPAAFTVLKDVYLGLFNDWDIGNSGNNSVAYSPEDSVLYLSDATPNSTQPTVAVAHLSPISSALAIDNAIEGQRDSVTFGLYDGFSDTEKKSSLTAGTQRINVQNTDASAVVASGPYSLEPGSEVVVGFVYAYGSDTEELRAQIAEARAQAPFQVSSTGRAESQDVPMQTKLFQNYPNPFNPSTQLRIDIPQAQHVNLTVYDVLGRKVKVLVDEQLEGRSHFIQFNGGDLSSGVYFARLKTNEGVQTIPMTLIK